MTEWSIPDGMELGRLQGSSELTRSIAVSPDGTLVAIAGADGAQVFELVTGQLVAQPISGVQTASAVFAPDGSRLVVAGRGAVVVDLATGDTTQLVSDEFWVFDAAFRPDGERLALSRSRDPVSGPDLVTFDGQVEVYSVGDWARLSVIPFGVTSGATEHERQVVDVEYSGDGAWLATGSITDVVVWDAVTLVKQQRVGVSAELTAVAFAPTDEGMTGELALATTDGFVTVWDLAGQEVLLRLPADQAIVDIDYSPDGRYLAATSSDGATTVHALDIGELVQLARGRLTRGFTDEECDRYLGADRCEPTT